MKRFRFRPPWGRRGCPHARHNATLRGLACYDCGRTLQPEPARYTIARAL